jgi:integrating conjugative element protein (TIGR03759 family)
MIRRRVAPSLRRMAAGLLLMSTAPHLAQAETTERQASVTPSVKTADTQISATEQARARVWGLDTVEWQRYRSLMQGVRGSVSPATLSPIEVLGIHARDQAERRRYAEQWATLMREDAERILAFQHAYDEAQQRLFPQHQLIDAIKLAMHQSQDKTGTDRALDSADRVLFFTATDCVACDALLDRLLTKLSTFDGIDLYLLDIAPGDEDRIRQWAGSRDIDPRWVHERRVTLNVDAGALDKLAGGIGNGSRQRPVVLRRRGDTLSPLSIARF